MGLVQEDISYLPIPFSLFLEGFKNCNVEIFLNRRSCMVATLEIIKENFPTVRS